MRALFRLLVVITGCLHLCGGHYGVLQVIAWTQMIVEYSGEKGLVQGAIQTFDGEHPCDLCLSITEAKKGDKDLPTQGSRQSEIVFKNLLAPEITRLSPSRPQDPPSLSGPDPQDMNSLFKAAPTPPPPRIALA
ncbi:hypothetical protein [Haloferula sp.]|uniref:hypothetical protein n=1 Tax=Haloferula sp. TaxID=2497595 RepID=UPI00329C3F7F